MAKSTRSLSFPACPHRRPWRTITGRGSAISRPKIGYVTGTWPAWSETFIAQELALFRDRLPVVPLSLRRGSGPPDPDFHFLTDEVAGAPGRKGRRIPLPSGLRTGLSKHRHRHAIAELVRASRENNVDHLYAAFGDLPGLIVAAAACELRIPFSVSIHAADVTASQFVDSQIYATATHVFACNACVADTIKSRSPHLAAKLRIVPHGLVLSKWPYHFSQTHGKPHILFVGRLVEKKDPILAARLAADFGRMFTVVGDGPLREEMRRVASENTVWCDRLTREEVAQAMREADCLLVTSPELPNDREGIPNVIVEAMASGLPVVAPLTGGIGEVLSQDTGFPARDADYECLGNALRQVSKAGLAQERCRTARALIDSRFDAQPLADQRVAWLSGLRPHAQPLR